jgi:NhaP-type Na+/H+ or K+/H+ antiporter
MENYTIILLFMALMIGASGIAEKIKIPAPVLLLLTGIAMGFIPQVQGID